MFVRLAILVAALAVPVASHGSPETGAIRVRGEWTIEVRNPDGTLAARHEFTNGLVDNSRGGASLLARLLTRDIEFGSWMVSLDALPSNPAPCSYSGNHSGCALRQAAATNGLPDTPAVFNTLSVSRGGANGNIVVLTGTVTVLSTGGIDHVVTSVGNCSPATVPAGQQCTSELGKIEGGQAIASELTRKDFPQRITVTQGQIIHVTVQISFS